MKVLAFGASNNRNSINKKLAHYASRLLEKAEIELIDLNDFEMPLFGEDLEKEVGQPEAAGRFLQKIKDADVCIISYAEHNGSYTAAYKNIFDWCSRLSKKVYENKKVILLSTSPGPQGAKSVLESAVKSMPFFGADVRGYLSIPSFYENYDAAEMRMKNEDLRQKLIECLKMVF